MPHGHHHEHDRCLPPLPPLPRPEDEGKEDTRQQAPQTSSSPLPSHDSHAAPVSQEASAWAYKVVRGSLYVVGPAIEALAETGHAHCLHHAIRWCMVPSLEPALFTRARSDRELRDGPAHHLTLLHRTDIQVEEGEKEEGGKDGRREDGAGDDAIASAAATTSVPISAVSASASFSPCEQIEDENEPPSLAPALHGSLSTMPEDRRDVEEEAQEQGGREGGTPGESQQNSTPAVLPPSSFSPIHNRHHDDDNEDEAVATALLARLTTPLSTHLLPLLPPLLHDPLPLYVYRTSGGGRALAVSVLFLPGEWLRHWQGQVYRPMHVTLGFVERDERDLEARQLGRVSVLGYGLSRRRTGKVLEALVGVLRKEGGREGGGLDGFLPRVRVLAGEVLRVLEMRMEGEREGGWEEEEEEGGMKEIKATVEACKRALPVGSLPSGAVVGV